MGKTIIRAPKRWNFGMMVGVAFLALQVVLVIHGQFVENRDFCWAPHTTQVQYDLQVEIGGRRLTKQEIIRRYGLRYAYGWEVHSYQNLIDLLIQNEQTYGKRDHARVALNYRINGKEQRTWRWPPE